MPTYSTRIVEYINARFFEDIENNNSLSIKDISIPPQIVQKINDLPDRDQRSEQPLVNQEIPIQPVVEPTFLEPLRRS